MNKAIIVFLVVIVLIVGFIISIPLVNNYSANNVEQELLRIALPDNTEMIESLSIAGKVVGNGNGMQYFGAILIKSEHTLDELFNYYSGKVDHVAVNKQKTQKIEVIDHSLSFSSNIDEEDDDYFIVYLFGDGIFPFSELDIRGH